MPAMATSSRPVLLVTGARAGIGKFLSQYYARHGYRVIGVSRRDAGYKLKDFQHFRADVSKPEDVARLFADIRKAYGRLDALINNAAVKPPVTPAMLTPNALARQAMEINFLGAFTMSVEAAKLMMARRFGRIVNISSMAVKHEVRGESIYAASKAALTTFTRVFAKEVYDHGITCNIVAPSAIDTGLMKTVDSKALAEVLKRNAAPKPGELKDVTNAILPSGEKTTLGTMFRRVPASSSTVFKRLTSEPAAMSQSLYSPPKLPVMANLPSGETAMSPICCNVERRLLGVVVWPNSFI